MCGTERSSDARGQLVVEQPAYIHRFHTRSESSISAEYSTPTEGGTAFQTVVSAPTQSVSSDLAPTTSISPKSYPMFEGELPELSNSLPLGPSEPQTEARTHQNSASASDVRPGMLFAENPLTMKVQPSTTLPAPVLLSTHTEAKSTNLHTSHKPSSNILKFSTQALAELRELLRAEIPPVHKTPLNSPKASPKISPKVLPQLASTGPAIGSPTMSPTNAEKRDQQLQHRVAEIYESYTQNCSLNKQMTPWEHLRTLVRDLTCLRGG